MAIKKRYIFQKYDKSEIGLGVLKRLYKRHSKHRHALFFAFSTTRGNYSDPLPNDSVYVTFSWNEPTSKQQENAIDYFFNKVYAIGELTPIGLE